MCLILSSLAFTSDLQTMQDIWRNCGPSSWSALIILSEPWISSSIGSDNRFVRKIAWNRKRMSIGIGLIQTLEEISMSSWINFSREELERTYFIQGSLFLIVSDDIDTASRTLQEHCRNNCVFLHADEAERKQSKFSRSRPLDMSQREFRQIGESAMQSDMRGAELVMSQFQNPTVFYAQENMYWKKAVRNVHYLWIFMNLLQIDIWCECSLMLADPERRKY